MNHQEQLSYRTGFWSFSPGSTQVQDTSVPFRIHISLPVVLLSLSLFACVFWVFILCLFLILILILILSVASSP